LARHRYQLSEGKLARARDFFAKVAISVNPPGGGGDGQQAGH
jgi:hypothetical protein